MKKKQPTGRGKGKAFVNGQSKFFKHIIITP